MENDLALNNDGMINDNIDDTSFKSGRNFYERTICCQAIVNMDAETNKDFFHSLSINSLLKKPVSKAIFSVLHNILFVIKVIFLFTLSAVYFVIGATAAILYMIIYENLYKAIFHKVQTRNQKSPYFYKWKKHHLDVKWEA